MQKVTRHRLDELDARLRQSLQEYPLKKLGAEVISVVDLSQSQMPCSPALLTRRYWRPALLETTGHTIKFQGYGSGELIVVTLPNELKNEFTYYQVVTATQFCTADPGYVSYPCHMFGAASKIYSPSEPKREIVKLVRITTDKLCAELEDIIASSLRTQKQRSGLR